MHAGSKLPKSCLARKRDLLTSAHLSAPKPIARVQRLSLSLSLSLCLCLSCLCLFVCLCLCLCLFLSPPPSPLPLLFVLLSLTLTLTLTLFPCLTNSLSLPQCADNSGEIATAVDVIFNPCLVELALQDAPGPTIMGQPRHLYYQVPVLVGGSVGRWAWVSGRCAV